METIFCAVCRNPIPEDRVIHRAITCSAICKTKLNEIRRSHKEEKFCRQCARPSTPEERKLFARWRRETFPAPKRGRPKNAKPEDAPAMLQASEESTNESV
jgi:predicted nucleic acid-binding Zn ribbon protein